MAELGLSQHSMLHLYLCPCVLLVESRAGWLHKLPIVYFLSCNMCHGGFLSSRFLGSFAYSHHALQADYLRGLQQHLSAFDRRLAVLLVALLAYLHCQSAYNTDMCEGRILHSPFTVRKALLQINII